MAEVETPTAETKVGLEKSPLQLVEDALQTMKIAVKDGSCADFTRLLQLQRELKKENETESIRKIEVLWIEPEPEAECCVEK